MVPAADRINRIKGTLGISSERDNKYSTLEEEVARLAIAQERGDAEVAVMRGIVAQTLSPSTTASEVAISKPKVHIPKPMPFNGAHCSKELKNFLWNMD